MATASDLWTYRTESGLADSALRRDISGFGVEALDGSIGKIDEATYEVSSSYAVVDTGSWIFGKKVMLPAGVIDRVDLNDEKVKWIGVRTPGTPAGSGQQLDMGATSVRIMRDELRKMMRERTAEQLKVLRVSSTLPVTRDVC